MERKFSNRYLAYIMGHEFHDEDLDKYLSGGQQFIISKKTAGMNHGSGYEQHDVIFKCMEDGKCYYFRYENSDTGITNIDNPDGKMECHEVERKVVKRTEWVKR